MSSIVTQFNPATANTSEFSAPNSAANGALVFFNESNISIDLTFADGSSMYLPAWYHRHKCGYSGSVNVQWDIRQTLSSSAPPISQVIVEAFAQGEHFPADGPLVRQANVGNTVSTVGGGATSVRNDGNTAGTSILETSVPGTATNQSATNDGIWDLAILISGVAHQFLKTQTTGHVLLLGQLGDTVEMQGNATVNNDLIVGSNAIDTRFQLLAWANQDITVPLAARANTSTQSADLFQALNSVGVPLAKIDKNGVLTTPTANFTTGSITRIAQFGAYGLGTTLASFNHNLGVVPDLILLQVVKGVTLGYAWYEDSTMTTTTVNLAANAGSVFVRGLAIKF